MKTVDEITEMMTLAIVTDADYSRTVREQDGAGGWRSESHQPGAQKGDSSSPSSMHGRHAAL